MDRAAPGDTDDVLEVGCGTGNLTLLVTVRHLLYQVSGLSKATGNAYATSRATGDSALEDRVRALRNAKLTRPVGTTWQYIRRGANQSYGKTT